MISVMHTTDVMIYLTTPSLISQMDAQIAIHRLGSILPRFQSEET